MEYKNQLVNTGEINDVGASIHSNIDESYRRGVEIETNLKLTKKLSYSQILHFLKTRLFLLQNILTIGIPGVKIL